LDSVAELAKAVRLRLQEKMFEAITEAMATNEMLFFRDNGPFERFSDHKLPPLLEVRATRKSLRV
jgi:chemotaxis protein methyltransferase CheR